MEMQKNYNPKDFEDRLYAEWMDKNYFRAEADPSKIPFTIVIPPPNITGQLHLGHALDNTIIDALIRFPRTSRGSCIWGTRSTIPSSTRSSASSACRGIPPCICPAATTLPSPPKSKSSNR